MRTVDLVLPSLAGGGAERVAVDLSAALAAKGFTARLVLVRAEGPLLAEVDGRVEVINLRAPRTSLALPALAHHLRRRRPAAVVASLTHANVVTVAARRLARIDVPLVLMEQNTLSRASRTGLLRDRLLPAAARRTYPRAEAVVACSTGVAEDLARVTGMDPSRITTIPLPVVTPSLLSAAATSVEQPWFSTDRPMIVAAGRLTRQKGFDVLVEAFALLCRDRSAYLTVLGDGPERTRLEERIRGAGLSDRVRLPGYVSNPYSWIAGADVFALPSRYEGMPNVLVAALALGTPIVATDCPSGPRELLRDGRLGRLVPVEDAPALAAALEATIASPPLPPPASAWEDYTLRRATERYVALLERLV